MIISLKTNLLLLEFNDLFHPIKANCLFCDYDLNIFSLIINYYKKKLYILYTMLIKQNI